MNDAAGAAPKGCYSEPFKYFSAGYRAKNMHICHSGKKDLYCKSNPKKLRCEKLDLEDGMSILNKSSFLRKKKSRKKEELATYALLMDWKGDIVKRSRMRIQIGDYAQIALSKNPFGARCFRALLQAAFKLNQSFPGYNFSVDDRITQCGRLIDGVNLLSKRQKIVRKIISRFHSPMHTVFFTNTTKFNHYILGEIGLHINTNRAGEIKKRLIDDKISQRDIRHERNRQSSVNHHKAGI